MNFIVLNFWFGKLIINNVIGIFFFFYFKQNKGKKNFWFSNVMLLATNILKKQFAIILCVTMIVSLFFFNL